MREACPNQEFSFLDVCELIVTPEYQVQLMGLVQTIILRKEAFQCWGQAGVVLVGPGSITEWRGCTTLRIY